MTAYIDLACWPRKEQFEFYRSLDRPQYSVCVQLDVTHFHARVKKRGISFSHTFGFFVTHAANEVPELRMRIKGGQVVLYDELHPSFTEPRAGGALQRAAVRRARCVFAAYQRGDCAAGGAVFPAR